MKKSIRLNELMTDQKDLNFTLSKEHPALLTFKCDPDPSRDVYHLNDTIASIVLPTVHFVFSGTVNPKQISVNRMFTDVTTLKITDSFFKFN